MTVRGSSLAAANKEGYCLGCDTLVKPVYTLKKKKEIRNSPGTGGEGWGGNSVLRNKLFSSAF